MTSESQSAELVHEGSNVMWGKWRSFIITLARTAVKSIRHAYRFIQTERFSRGMIAAVDLVGEIYSFTAAMTA